MPDDDIAAATAERDEKARQLGTILAPRLMALSIKLGRYRTSDDGRERLVHDLEAIGRFLDGLPGSDDRFDRAAIRLMGLGRALLALNDGKVEALPAPARVQNRPPPGPRDQMIAAAAAFAMEAEIHRGLTRSAAAARVARLLRQAGIYFGAAQDRQPTKATVAGWRDRLNAATQVGTQVGPHWTLAEAQWAIQRAKIDAGEILRPDAADALISALPGRLDEMGF